MSEEIGSVRVWTVETTYVNADHAEVKPYRAVIAAEDQSGRIVRAKTIGRLATAEAVEFASVEDLEANLAELGQTASIEILPFANREQAERFSRYFATIVAPNDTTQRAGTRPDADYNCFDFARYVVRGEEPQGWVSAATKALAEARPGYVKTGGPFALGAEGYVIDAFRDRWSPIHTFVGLGRDRQECLSVLVQGGPIAITSYDNVMQPYRDALIFRPALARARWGLGRLIRSHVLPNKPALSVRTPQ